MYLKRIVTEVFGGCNYACEMCPQSTPGRDREFLKTLPFDLYKKILDQVEGSPTVLLSGSGEATLHKDLPRYVEEAARRGMLPIIYTNGLLVKGQRMRDLFDAGLHLCRFSVIGYNKQTYAKSMAIDAWDEIFENVYNALAYAPNHVSSYHLILDNNHVNFETQQYLQNFVNPLNIKCEIWKQHNWSGNLKGVNRQGVVSKCGKPFAPELTIRAGGIGDHRGAVVSCCQTLGPPNEIPSVLGHADTQSLEDIVNSLPMQNLREAHNTGDWTLAPYCKDCDFRLHDPEVLVYSNNNNKLYHYDIADINLQDYI